MGKKTVLHTPLCDYLGIEYPIILAGMGNYAHEELAAAVSNAGGLGVLGRSTTYCRALTDDELRARIRRTREMTDRPIGVDLVLPSAMIGDDRQGVSNAFPKEYRDYIDKIYRESGLPVFPPEEGDKERPWANVDLLKGQLRVLCEEKVPIFASGLGLADWAVPMCREAGVKIIAVVGNVKNARRVVKTGADVVVAQGYDAGGHTGRVGTLSLVPQVVDAVSPIPTIAAGGIVDGRGLAAAISLGAQAVWCGTVFLSTKECPSHPNYKQRIVDMTEEDTLVSKSVSGKTARYIRNGFIDIWEKGPMPPLPFPYQFELWKDLRRAGVLAGNIDYQPLPAGQGGGMIKEVKSAGQVVAEMVEQAADILSRPKVVAVR